MSLKEEAADCLREFKKTMAGKASKFNSIEAERVIGDLEIKINFDKITSRAMTECMAVIDESERSHIVRTKTMIGEEETKLQKILELQTTDWKKECIA